MSGIVFFRTEQPMALRDFYVGKVGMDVWLEQEDCTIYQQGNLLLGFCVRDSSDSCGIVTFFFDTKDEVDLMFDRFRQEAEKEPRIDRSRSAVNTIFSSETLRVGWWNSSNSWRVLVELSRASVCG